MPWVETTSPHFAARHELVDDDDVAGVLELLEGTRERLADAFATIPGEIEVVVHGSDAALAAAQPYLPVLRRMVAPAARRYLVGWFGAGSIHVLAPRVLIAHASNVAGSREMNLLAPAALYAQLVVGVNNQRLPPPFGPVRFARYVRWAWLQAGAAQWFSGQTAYARPAIARRLREGPEPDFPPGVRDAHLLGGTRLRPARPRGGRGRRACTSPATCRPAAPTRRCGARSTAARCATPRARGARTSRAPRAPIRSRRLVQRTAARGRPPAGRSGSRSSASAVAPNRSSRPPNAIAHTANHAHPSARPADHVAQPVDVEQHPRRRDRDREPGGDAREHDPRAAARVPREDQRRRREEGRRP